MIQLILRITKFCLVLLLTIFLGSCKVEVETPIFNSIKGSGNVTTEKREIPDDFDKIKVSATLKVELEQASDFEIIVEADDNILPYIVTEVSGNTLNVYYDNISIRNPKEAKIYVKMPKISELSASSSSEIETKKPIKSDDLILKASSTADIKLYKITATSIIAEASSSSDIEIGSVYTTSFKAQSSSTADIDIEYIESDKIDLTANSSSDIELKGKALDLSAKTSSTGTIDAKELLVNNVTASSSSSSKISVYPIVSLTAKATSASSVYYYNEPKTIDKNTSSSGSVKRK